jgi:hypothetical protein
MLILHRATVTWDDDGIFENLEGARVTYHGNVASIWRRNERGSFTQVDRLTEADYKEGATNVFTGISQHLVQDVGVAPADAKVTIRVKGDNGCPNC